MIEKYLNQPRANLILRSQVIGDCWDASRSYVKKNLTFENWRSDKHTDSIDQYLRVEDQGSQKLGHEVSVDKLSS